MNRIVLSLFIAFCAIAMMSCNTFEPEKYKSDIEDCLRFELSSRQFMENLAQYESMHANLGLASRFIFTLSEYQQTLEYVNHAKRAHGQGWTYYATLDYLWVNMEAYAPEEGSIEVCRKVIKLMKQEYNKIELSMTPFEKITRNKYMIKERNSGAVCFVTNEGNDNVSFFVDIEK